MGVKNNTANGSGGRGGVRERGGMERGEGGREGRGGKEGGAEREGGEKRRSALTFHVPPPLFFHSSEQSSRPPQLFGSPLDQYEKSRSVLSDHCHPGGPDN
jgi:hypothetical protein